jgi:hypothetical protein
MATDETFRRIPLQAVEDRKVAEQAAESDGHHDQTKTVAYGALLALIDDRPSSDISAPVEFRYLL